MKSESLNVVPACELGHAQGRRCFAGANSLSHFKVLKRRSGNSWAAFHKFGRSAPHRRRYCAAVSQGCRLTIMQSGALIAAFPDSGRSLVRIRGHYREASMKLRFQTTLTLLTLAAWPAVAQPAPPAPSTLETLGAMRQTGSTADWPVIPQTGQKADQVKRISPRSNCRRVSTFRCTRWCRTPATSRSARRASRRLWARENRRSGW